MAWQKQYKRQENNYRRNREKINKEKLMKWRNLSVEKKAGLIRIAKIRRRVKRQEFLEENKDKIRAKKSMAFIKAKKKNAEKQNRYMKRRRNSDPKFRMKLNIRSSINQRLRKRLLSKNGKKTFNFLPYTIDDLMGHLEKQFIVGMSWDNYGDWHIDHIVPESLFEYKRVDDEVFVACWALNNLQPLWANDNIKKSNKIMENKS